MAFRINNLGLWLDEPDTLLSVRAAEKLGVALGDLKSVRVVRQVLDARKKNSPRYIYTVEVDHDFRRWLTAIGRFTWGALDYQGDNRKDKIYTLSGEAIYKMNRNVWLRGTLRRDWLDSNLPGNSTVSTVVMLGVRLQN